MLPTLFTSNPKIFYHQRIFFKLHHRDPFERIWKYSPPNPNRTRRSDDTRVTPRSSLPNSQYVATVKYFLSKRWEMAEDSLSGEMKSSRKSAGAEIRRRRSMILYLCPCSYRSLSTLEQSLSPPEFSGLPIQSEWSFLRLSRVHVTHRRRALCLSTGDKEGERVEGSKNHFHVHGCPHYGYMHGRATSALETEVISREPEDRDKNRNWVLDGVQKILSRGRVFPFSSRSRICGG